MNYLKCLFIVGSILPAFLRAQIVHPDTARPSPFITFCSSRTDDVEKPIHMDWVQKDKDIITEKINKLPANGSTVTGIEKLVPHFIDGKCNCRSETEDLGYELKSTRHTIYGGYGSFGVDAVYWGNEVISLRLTVHNHTELIRDYLMEVMQLPFQCVNGQISYEITYRENLEKYRNGSGRLFLSSADTNLRRRRPLIISPMC